MSSEIHVYVIVWAYTWGHYGHGFIIDNVSFCHHVAAVSFTVQAVQDIIIYQSFLSDHNLYIDLIIKSNLLHSCKYTPLSVHHVNNGEAAIGSQGMSFQFMEIVWSWH